MKTIKLTLRFALLFTTTALLFAFYVLKINYFDEYKLQNMYVMLASTKSKIESNSTVPRIIFFDGANIGDSFEEAMSSKQRFFPPDIKQYFSPLIEAYLFEVNPRFDENLEQVKQKYKDKVKLIVIEKKAVWDHVAQVEI